jgi:uncharacterized phiE125 gp8 family phage protein
MADEPTSLAAAKSQLRVDGTEEDGLIANLITAAREEVEAATGLILTLRATRDSFDRTGTLELSGWPIADDAAVTVTYLADGGTMEPLLGYRLANGKRPAKLVPDGASGYWRLGPDAILATYQAGYATPADVPFMLKAAILLLVSIEYERRAPTAEEGSRLESIYGRYRLPVIG